MAEGDRRHRLAGVMICLTDGKQRGNEKAPLPRGLPGSSHSYQESFSAN